MLFVMYTVDLIRLIKSHGLMPHVYADDTQVYGSCLPPAVSALSTNISQCVGDVASWASSNRLQLNPAKTEVTWCATVRRQHQLPSCALLFAGVPVVPVKFIQDLGIHINADLSMQTHVQRTVSRCFGAALHQLHRILRSVPTITLHITYLLLVTCRMMSFLSIAFNAHILPVLVQPSLERAHCWRIHDMLGEAVPIVDHSLAEEISL